MPARGDTDGGVDGPVADVSVPDEPVADEPVADRPVADEPVVVLLRAVNVGGAGKVAMPALREAAVALGHTEVATYLGTGNLVLRPAHSGTATDGPGSAALTETLTDALRERLGLPLELMVRTCAEIDAVVQDNPYPEVAEDDPAHLVVLFLDGPAPTEPPDLSRYGRERATWHGDEAYLHYPDGIGRSKVTASVLDRASGRRGTGRNWRTVLALQQMLHDRT
ncbi:MAG TPA: DUF1697 domain-containing protein [Cellulomonas sp.]